MANLATRILKLKQEYKDKRVEIELAVVEFIKHNRNLGVSYRKMGPEIGVAYSDLCQLAKKHGLNKKPATETL